MFFLVNALDQGKQKVAIQKKEQCFKMKTWKTRGTVLIFDRRADDFAISISRMRISSFLFCRISSSPCRCAKWIATSDEFFSWNLANSSIREAIYTSLLRNSFSKFELVNGVDFPWFYQNGEISFKIWNHFFEWCDFTSQNCVRLP